MIRPRGFKLFVPLIGTANNETHAAQSGAMESKKEIHRQTIQHCGCPFEGEHTVDCPTIFGDIARAKVCEGATESAKEKSK